MSHLLTLIDVPVLDTIITFQDKPTSIEDGRNKVCCHISIVFAYYFQPSVLASLFAKMGLTGNESKSSNHVQLLADSIFEYVLVLSKYT